jgi:hypothetical protein
LTSVRCLPRLLSPISTVLLGLSGLTNISLVVSKTLRPSHRYMLLSLKEEEELCAVKHHNDKCTMTGRKLSANLTGHHANASRHSISWTKVLAQSRNSVRKILWRTERRFERILSLFFFYVSTFPPILRAHISFIYDQR